MALRPGSSYELKYEVSASYRLPQPYGNCMEEKSMEVRNQTLKYGIRACVSFCLAKTIATKCGCVYANSFIVWFKANDSFPYCGDIKLPPEKLISFWRCFKKANKVALMKCPKECPEQCLQSTYSSTVSSALWPIERYQASFYNKMIKNKSFQEDFDRYVSNYDTSMRSAISENFMKISCYLGSYKQKVLRNTPKYSVSGLLSEVGSILNMWSGITIVLGVEIIELIGRWLTEVFAKSQVNKVSMK